MSLPLRRKVAVVTGGSRGIGLALCRLLLEKGAKVAFCSSDEGRLRDAEDSLRSMGDVMGYCCDVRDHQAMGIFVDRVRSRFGAVDILVNNAGVLTVGDFVGQPLEEIDEVLDVNIKGVAYACRLFMPDMLDRRSGVVINLSSGLGKSGMGGVATYCASKFAIIGLTESLAQEAARYGVSVYSVCPGMVATDMQAQFSGVRAGMSPEYLAGRIYELLSEESEARPGDCLEVYR